MYKATRPFEYICFYPVEIPTRDEGDVYTFVAVDVYSRYLMITGTEKDRSNNTVLKHIRLLTEHKDFVKHKGEKFTLVVHAFRDIVEDIDRIIEPLNGKVIIDDSFVTEIITPVIEHLFESFDKTK